jgi:site-specific DNA-cytosine methylase
MSFQDRYSFIGPKLAMQIGNAVPPLLAKAVGETILQRLIAPEKQPAMAATIA